MLSRALELVVLGDVHDQADHLTAVLRSARRLRPAIAILVGDLGIDPPWDEPRRRVERSEHDASVGRVIGSVSATFDCPVVFVPGNHDLPDPAAIRGATNVDGRLVEVNGLRIAGLGGAGPRRYGFAYEWDEAWAERRLLDAVPPGIALDLLVCHAPPARSGLDRVARGAEVGSEAVRRAVERIRPRLFVCGHVHEASGAATIDGVPCLNAGSLGEPFGTPLLWHVTLGRKGDIPNFRRVRPRRRRR